MPNPPRDRELAEHLTVLRAQLGDREAYSALFARYNRRLLYYLRRLVGPTDADDVLQEVWMTVIKKLAALERAEAFKPWLYRIAHNRAISRLRRRPGEVPLDEVPEEREIDPATSPADEDERAFDAYDAAALHRGLARLSPAHREVLTLRFLERLSYQEIAEVVGCTLGTVRSRIHYAKRSLHDRLASAPVAT